MSCGDQSKRRREDQRAALRRKDPRRSANRREPAELLSQPKVLLTLDSMNYFFAYVITSWNPGISSSANFQLGNFKWSLFYMAVFFSRDHFLRQSSATQFQISFSIYFPKMSYSTLMHIKAIHFGCYKSMCSTRLSSKDSTNMRIVASLSPSVMYAISAIKGSSDVSRTMSIFMCLTHI